MWGGGGGARGFSGFWGVHMCMQSKQNQQKIINYIVTMNNYINWQTVKYNRLREASGMKTKMLIKIILDTGSVQSCICLQDFKIKCKTFLDLFLKTWKNELTK